eukprot:TRINITY_DN3439_c0_g1_i1.p1 TRINITY_DN3439_c0_g1~~TRINITY_DN3439_c0_g1_i1.p1  ORF type:complete len:292 (+),score=48.43 TRINITY_DN3439_c0_g1_i1:76-876(+)
MVGATTGGGDDDEQAPKNVQRPEKWRSRSLSVWNSSCALSGTLLEIEIANVQQLLARHPWPASTNVWWQLVSLEPRGHVCGGPRSKQHSVAGIGGLASGSGGCGCSCSVLQLLTVGGHLEVGLRTSQAPASVLPPVTLRRSNSVHALSNPFLRGMHPRLRHAQRPAGVPGSADNAVTCVPDVFEFHVSSSTCTAWRRAYASSNKDKFLVLGCDGLYDALTNQRIADFVTAKLSATQQPITQETLEQIALELVTCASAEVNGRTSAP